MVEEWDLRRWGYSFPRTNKGIKEYTGHASIVETQKYLDFMPQSVDLRIFFAEI